MTLNENQTKEVVGSCPFGLKTFLYQNQRLQHTVPNDTSDLDRVVCGYTNRTLQYYKGIKVTLTLKVVDFVVNFDFFKSVYSCFELEVRASSVNM